MEEHTPAGEITHEEDKTLSNPQRQNYSQNWPAYNRAQTIEKELFLRLLKDITTFEQEQNFGRPKLNLGELAFCCALKVFSGASSRRTDSDIRFACEKGYLTKRPCYNSVINGFNSWELTDLLEELIRKSSLPLATVETSFAIDSTGFGSSQFARWFDHKWGKETYKQKWMKAHACCGTTTNIITAVKVTGGHSADVVEFQELVEETAQGFRVLEVSADKAYLSRRNLETVESLGATPFIPFKSNSKGRALGSPIWKRMYYYFQLNRDEFLQHYHKRSNIETCFSMIKAKFGNRLRNKTEIGQKNEILCKVLCHNLCVIIQEMHEIGITPDFFENKQHS
ncbi:MAG: transposase [archaeon]